MKRYIIEVIKEFYSNKPIHTIWLSTENMEPFQFDTKKDADVFIANRRSYVLMHDQHSTIYHSLRSDTKKAKKLLSEIYE